MWLDKIDFIMGKRKNQYENKELPTDKYEKQNENRYIDPLKLKIDDNGEKKHEPVKEKHMVPGVSNKKIKDRQIIEKYLNMQNDINLCPKNQYFVRDRYFAY